MSNYDSIDLDFTWDGDFLVSNDGDIGDTRDDTIRSLENEVRTILKSEFDDWERDPGIGANLSDFRGEPNNRAIGQALEDRIAGRIIATGIVKAEDIKVRVLPVGKHQVLVTLNINVTVTPSNRLSAGQPLVVQLTYDSLEDSVFFLEESKTKQDARVF